MYIKNIFLVSCIFFLSHFVLEFQKPTNVTLTVMKCYFYLSHVRMARCDCMKIYVEKLTRNSFLDFYCSCLVFVTTGVITSTLKVLVNLRSNQDISYFSERYHHHPGSQTRNPELFLETFLSLPPHPPPAPPPSGLYQVLSSLIFVCFSPLSPLLSLP